MLYTTQVQARLKHDGLLQFIFFLVIFSFSKIAKIYGMIVIKRIHLNVIFNRLQPSISKFNKFLIFFVQWPI